MKQTYNDLTNLNITLNAIHYCLQNNAKLIFISSASVKLLNNDYAFINVTYDEVLNDNKS